MRISDWSSDVCSSDLGRAVTGAGRHGQGLRADGCAAELSGIRGAGTVWVPEPWFPRHAKGRQQRENQDRRPVLHTGRSEEHTSELQSLMRISYAVFCLKKKTKTK